jgi:pseudaminic acid cytidylyltransferase
MQNKKLCIIPARGGSKRIPRKNIRDFLGKPIITYSIEAAIQSQLFDEVMVSTDDNEIAKVAADYGAKVPFLRSNETSNDFATTFDVIKEVINEYKTIGKDFDYVCCIYACAPFVTSAKLENSFQLLIDKDYDSVFPVMPFGFPIQRALKQESNTVQFFYPEFAISRSQDLEKSYHDAGQFYWINMEICLEKNRILTENTGCIILSEIEGQDIDNEVDWKLAELKYELLQSTQ